MNKADGPHEIEAKRAARELEGALRLMGTSETGWNAPVLTCSGLTDAGLDEVWGGLESHLGHLRTSGRFERMRAEQQVAWMWATVRDDLDARLRSSQDVQALRAELEEAVRSGELSPVHAADRIVAAFLKP